MQYQNQKQYQETEGMKFVKLYDVRYLFMFLFVAPLISFSQSSVLSNAKQSFEEKKYEIVEQTLEAYLKISPNDLEGIELLGDAYGQQEKWDHAIDAYEKLVALKPNVANYHYKFGGALGMKALSVSKLRAVAFIGDIKSAFLKAAELDPKHINTRWALVELYMQLPGIIGGSKSKSLKYADELQALSEVDGYLAKGYVYEYDDEPELAEEFYKKAIKIGGSLTCFDKLTKLYESQKQPEKAIANIEDAQKKHKRNALHYQIGKVAAEYNIELNKGQRCLQIYIKNHSAADGVPTAWANYRLAQIHRHKGNQSEALKYINLAITALPKIKAFQKEKTDILKL
ncbi:tetratricopeptide repeat protein [Psychroserpens ponticola]|uniref:Tetratricopeptide repeat protein n=1 Tax=Psychroserpens ponticola TaxID=2932268 RepID=A0ABY7RZ58_9FLAO|nr:tetratricopeptide repeat protein [Psychroserpens ponticola]WCO00975.1 tetratricopeptide repeat protein [Psychroserpens ponticola]